VVVVPGLPTGPIVHGRLLDEGGQPLRRHEVEVRLVADGAPPSTATARPIITDAKGRFLIGLADQSAKPAKRRLQLVVDAPAREGDRLVKQ
jgi:hypothetical protein